MTDLDLDHLRGWIGRTETAQDQLTPALADRFRATFDLAPAKEAPPMIHLCLAPPAAPTAALGPDGHPARGGFLPPVPLPRRMWAGGEMVFHAPLPPGAQVARHSTIRDVAVKPGRSGPLCFVTVDHAITAAGRLAVTERQDIVYRAATPPGAAAPAAPAAPRGDHVRSIEPSAVLLFRYSALTFNGHRIHYDRRHATGPEGYPGLVVHGPMQATLLCLMAADLRGAPPARFSFRSLSPLFDDAPVLLNATGGAAGPMRLWTARPDGPVAMQAQADW